MTIPRKPVRPRTRRRFGLCALFAAALAAATGAQAEPNHLVTTVIPSLTSRDGSGLFDPCIEDIVREAGLDGALFVPWRRAMLLAEQGPNVAILPLARTAEREDKFIWIAPLTTLEFSFATVSGETADTFEDARRRFASVGVWLGSFQQTILEGKGFDNLEPIQGSRQAAEMLRRGRVAAWFTTTLEQRKTWATLDAPPVLTIGAPVHERTVWVAASANSDSEFVARLRQVAGTLELPIQPPE